MRLRTVSRAFAAALAAVLILLPRPLLAAGHGAFEDKLADILVWVVLIVAPVVGIIVFLAVHIIPEKVAENREHPQLDAIKVLCLLSLVFGGILWPLAWIWAYTKPVMHKMAYGVDRVALKGHGEAGGTPMTPADEAEIERLRRRLLELETGTASGQVG